jgi:hypothetical protein
MLFKRVLRFVGRFMQKHAKNERLCLQEILLADTAGICNAFLLVP